MSEHDDEIAALKGALAAAQRTIEVLMDRVEQPVLAADADRFALLKTVSQLQDTVRQNDRARARTAEHYQALYDNSPDAIVTLRDDGRVSDCNSSAERLFGRDRSTVQDASLSSLLDPASGSAMMTLLWSGFSGVGESDVRLTDGRRLSFSVAALRDGGWLVVFRDVTRNRRLDQELLHARRLASVGQLASSVSREINTPLSVIQGRLELLAAHESAAGAPAQRQLDVIQDQCLRISNLVLDLQTFAVQQKPQRVWQPVSALVAQSQAMVAPRLRRVRIAPSEVPHGIRIHGDAVLLQQMLSGLLRHLGDRSRPGSEVVVRAERVDGGVKLIVRADAVDASHVDFKAVRSPQSGRQVDPALGFHLAIAWAIAQDHAGWLTGEELPGGAAALYVFIPNQTADEPEAGPVPLRMLVVDDDQNFCEALSIMLSQDGHRTTTAASAEEALGRLRHEEFDVLLTDYLLTGMNGEQLIARVRERWPELGARTILTSGLLHTPQVETAYLQKPFTRAQLAQTMRALTGG